MKQTMFFLKVMSFLFVFFLVNSIYSQSTCGAGYSFNISGNNTTCNYTFTATTPMSPTVVAIDWTIASHGTYGSTCYTGSGTPFTTQFCFEGYYDINMKVTFSGGSWCNVRQLNVYISCNYAPWCDPDPARSIAIPDPVVEITYLQPVLCASGVGGPVTGCMYTNNSGSYDIACAWQWALRIPPIGYNCNFWTYYVEYSKVNSCGTPSCQRDPLSPNVVTCITAYVGEQISIVATANDCCAPSGYQRGITWTPQYGSQFPIGDPTTVYGVCSASRTCGNTDMCSEDQQTMSATSGWPVPVNCFSGGNKLEQRVKSVIAENAIIEQNVIIYNVQGAEVFKGKWKFGDSKNMNLNWPENIGTGIYFVKFLNSSSKELTKLYKIN